MRGNDDLLFLKYNIISTNNLSVFKKYNNYKSVIKV